MNPTSKVLGFLPYSPRPKRRFSLITHVTWTRRTAFFTAVDPNTKKNKLGAQLTKTYSRKYHEINIAGFTGLKLMDNFSIDQFTNDVTVHALFDVLAKSIGASS